MEYTKNTNSQCLPAKTARSVAEKTGLPGLGGRPWRPYLRLVGGASRRQDVVLVEETLDEVLNEPIIQLLMQRDGVRPEEVRLLLKQANERALQGFVPPHVIDQTCLWRKLCA